MLESSGSYASSGAGFFVGLYRLHIGGGGPLYPRPWTCGIPDTKTYQLVCTTEGKFKSVAWLQEANRKEKQIE